MPKDRRNSIVPEVNRGTLEDKILRSATTSSHQASFVHSMYTWCLVRPSDDVRGELPGSLPSSVSFGEANRSPTKRGGPPYVERCTGGNSGRRPNSRMQQNSLQKIDDSAGLTRSLRRPVSPTCNFGKSNSCRVSSHCPTESNSSMGLRGPRNIVNLSGFAQLST